MVGEVTDEDAAATDEVAEGAGDGAERIGCTEGGATGCGAANWVDDVGLDVAGLGDRAAKGFVLGGAAAGEVAD